MKKRVAILGIHRGGTSAVAGVVRRLGAFMGNDLLPPSKYNPRGYFEDAGIVDLHTEMIGGDWRYPAVAHPPMDIGFVPDSYIKYRRALIKFEKYDFWAIKDPRLCYCFPVLRYYRPSGLKVITVYRDPWYAASSLQVREGSSFSWALDLSLAYTEQLVQQTKGVQQLRLRYTDLITSPEKAVDKIAGYIGVPPTDAAYESVDPSLAHWERIDAKNIMEA